jgi:hypothetical protein
VVGDGPLDLVFALAYSTHLELNWEWPALRRVPPSSWPVTIDADKLTILRRTCRGGCYRQGISIGHEGPRPRRNTTISVFLPRR